MIEREYYTIKEVCELLNVDRQTVVRYIKRGKLKMIKLPLGRIRIPLKEVEYLVNGGKNR